MFIAAFFFIAGSACLAASCLWLVFSSRIEVQTPQPQMANGCCGLLHLFIYISKPNGRRLPVCSRQIGWVPPHLPCLSRFFCFSWCLNPIFLYATCVLERGHQEDRDDRTHCWPRPRATDFASTGDTHPHGLPSLLMKAAKKWQIRHRDFA